jgi:hypothetical protein
MGKRTKRLSRQDDLPALHPADVELLRGIESQLKLTNASTERAAELAKLLWDVTWRLNHGDGATRAQWLVR